MPAAKAKAKKKSGPALSPRAQKGLLIGVGSVLVITVAWWAYFKFTTIPPPDLTTATPEQVDNVVAFLGSPRGLPRMGDVEKQREFLLNAYQTFSRDESRERMIQAMNRMSSAEREVLGSVVFEIARVDVVKQAREYNRTPPSQRRAFVDNAIRNFENLRNELSGAKIRTASPRDRGGAAGGGGGGASPRRGGGPPGGDLAAPFKQDMPKSSDEMMKVLVTRTNASERAEAKPFIDAVGERMNEINRSPSARARFDGGR